MRIAATGVLIVRIFKRHRTLIFGFRDLAVACRAQPPMRVAPIISNEEESGRGPPESEGRVGQLVINAVGRSVDGVGDARPRTCAKFAIEIPMHAEVNARFIVVFDELANAAETGRYVRARLVPEIVHRHAVEFVGNKRTDIVEPVGIVPCELAFRAYPPEHVEAGASKC